jgi:hypothetical protein
MRIRNPAAEGSCFHGKGGTLMFSVGSCILLLVGTVRKTKILTQPFHISSQDSAMMPNKRSYMPNQNISKIGNDKILIKCSLP